MRHPYTLPTLLLALATLLTACADGDPSPIGPQMERVPVSFSTGAYVDVKTRATEEDFEVGDELGIFAVDTLLAGADTLLATGNYADNVHYVYDGMVFTPTDEPIMRDKYSPWAFAYYAVYPYDADMGPKFRFTARTDQRLHADYTGSDLAMQKLCSRALNVILELKHLMANMDVRLTGEDVDAHETSVEVTSALTTVDVNLNAQTVRAVEGTEADVTCERYMTGTEECRFRAIIAPQRLMRSKQAIAITVDGTRYVMELPWDVSIPSNYRLSLVYEMETDDEGYIRIRFGGIETGTNPVDAPTL